MQIYQESFNYKILYEFQIIPRNIIQFRLAIWRLELCACIKMKRNKHRVQKK